MHARTLTIFGLAVVLMTAVLSSVAGAATSAPPAGITLKVAPAVPRSNEPISVSFQSSRALNAHHHYIVQVSNACGTFSAPVTGPLPTSGMVSVTLPLPTLPAGVVLSPARATAERKKGWCTGAATAALRDSAIPGSALAKRTFTIRGLDLELAHTTPLTVLTTSTITVRTPSFSDRVMPLGGSLRASVLPRPPSADVFRSQFTGGSLVLPNIPVSSLCTSPAFSPALRVGSKQTEHGLRITSDGAASMTLAVDADPVSLAGCVGAPTGTTSITLTGKLGPRKLADLELTGSVDGIPIIAGMPSTATVVLHLRAEAPEPSETVDVRLPSSPHLSLTPAFPLPFSPISFSFKGDGLLNADQRYHVLLRGPRGVARCDAAARDLRVKGFVAKGKLATVEAPVPAAGGWCPGTWRALIVRVDLDGRKVGRASLRTFTISVDADHLPAAHPERATLSVQVLGTSTLTVRTSGQRGSRPDRVMNLTGTFSGGSRAAFVAGADFQANLTRGAFGLSSLTADPACPGLPYILDFPLAAEASSTATFLASGAVSMTLDLSVAPKTFAGCPGAIPGATALTVTGAVDPQRLAKRELTDIELTGTVAGVAIATGVSGSVAVDLHVTVGISGS